jgi:hypothetical protein
MANEKTPVVWDDDAKKHRPLGSGEKMGGLSASSMISSDSGNLLQQGSDGLMLVTGSSLADPRADNLLEESDNGKLQVTSDRVVEWLEGHPQAAAAIAEAVKVVSGDAGNVITAGTDKGAFMSKDTLAGAVSTMSAAQLAALAGALSKQGGGLSVGDDGKLSVDFGSMDPAIMRGVVLSMVQQGGGIAVDASGKLYVDFDNMPTDKFEALLKSLKMQIPLESNMSVYVDANAGSDVVEDGRGTQAKPWRTMTACVDYITQTYALGRYSIDIIVGPGVYSHQLRLPSFTRTSGFINVRAANAANRPVFSNSGSFGTCCSVSGGVWNFYDINFVCNFATVQGDAVPRSPAVFGVGAGEVYIYGGCSFTASYSGPAASQNFSVFVFSVVVGGVIYFVPREGKVLTFEYHKNSASALELFHVSRGGTINLMSANFEPSAINEYDFTATGEATTFCSVISDSSFILVGGGLHNPRIVVPSGFTATGRKHNVQGGSGCAAPYGGFPGDAEGNVESATYCWYTEAGA